MPDSEMDIALALQGAYTAISRAVWSAARYGVMARPIGYEDPRILHEPREPILAPPRKCCACGATCQWYAVECNGCERARNVAQYDAEALAGLHRYLEAASTLARTHGLIFSAPYHDLLVQDRNGAEISLEDIEWDGYRYRTAAQWHRGADAG